MTSQGAPEDGAWVQYPDGSIWSSDGTRCAVSAYASATCGRAGDYYECAGVTSEVKLRIIPEVLEALNRSAASPSTPPGVGEPDFWAVHSKTGMHIGLWPDKVLAEGVLRQYEGGTLTPLFRAPPVGVEVVKLEWRSEPHDTEGLTYASDGFGHLYWVHATNVYKSPPWHLDRRREQIPYASGRFDTVEAAKSAAQADFETRIRSALVPSSLLKEAPDGGNEAEWLSRHEKYAASFASSEVEFFELLKEAEEALRPFANVAEHDIGETETDADLFRPMQDHNRAPKLTVGDIRNAARILARLGAAP